MKTQTLTAVLTGNHYGQNYWYNHEGWTKEIEIKSLDELKKEMREYLDEFNGREANQYSCQVSAKWNGWNLTLSAGTSDSSGWKLSNISYTYNKAPKEEWTKAESTLKPPKGYKFANCNLGLYYRSGGDSDFYFDWFTIKHYERDDSFVVMLDDGTFELRHPSAKLVSEKSYKGETFIKEHLEPNYDNDKIEDYFERQRLYFYNYCTRNKDLIKSKIAEVFKLEEEKDFNFEITRNCVSP